MTGGLGEGQERCPDETVCIDYPEHGSGAVVAFTAVDPEGEDVTWTLATGGDVALFNISEGRLTFIEPPDYEDPADTGTNNVYEVTIRGHGHQSGIQCHQA